MNQEEETNTVHLQEQLDLYRKVVESYRLREQLLSLVGTTEPQVIASMIQSMEEQLKDFYATKDADHPDQQHLSSTDSMDSASLMSELGTSDASEIIAMVKNMEAQLKDFYATKDADHPAFSAEDDQSEDTMKLKDELGTANFDEIIAMVKNMEDQLRDFYELKDEGLLNEDLLLN